MLLPAGELVRVAAALLGQVHDLQELATRFRIWSPGASGPSARIPTLSATVMFGKSAYDWKTIPTLRWFGGPVGDVPAVDRDRARGRLLEAGDHPERRRLAAADGPRNDTNSPFSADRLKSSTATNSPKRFWTSVSVR